MDDNWTNSSNITDEGEGGSLITTETHLVLHSLIFLLLCAPTLLLSLGSTIALVIATGINKVMRLVLIHMSLSNGAFAVSMTLWIFSVPVRYLANLQLKSTDSSCRLTGSVFIVGGVGRFFSGALFCVVVFMLVKHPSKLKMYHIIGVILFQWAFSILWSIPAYLPSYGFRLISRYFCVVSIPSGQTLSYLAIYIHIGLSWIFVGIVSCVTTTCFAIYTHHYIKKNSIADNEGDLKKSCNNLAILFAISLVLNLIGLLLIPTSSLLIPFSGRLAFFLAYYIPLCLMALSALPIPLLMITLLSPVKLALKNLLLLRSCGCRPTSPNAVHPDLSTYES